MTKHGMDMGEGKVKPKFWVCEKHEPLSTFPIAQSKCLVCGNSEMRLVDWGRIGL